MNQKKIEELERLRAFIEYQRGFWIQLLRGDKLSKGTIKIWIEDCDSAKEDLETIAKEMEKDGQAKS